MKHVRERSDLRVWHHAFDVWALVKESFRRPIRVLLTVREMKFEMSVFPLSQYIYTPNSTDAESFEATVGVLLALVACQVIRAISCATLVGVSLLRLLLLFGRDR